MQFSFLLFSLFFYLSFSLQTNLCPRYDDVRLGRRNISTALAGHNLTAGVNSNTAPFLMTYNSTGQPIKGLIHDILKEIASRGQFQIIYQVVKTPKGYSLTQQLEYALPKVDIMASKYYIDSTSRRSAGIGFTYVRRLYSCSLSDSFFLFCRVLLMLHLFSLQHLVQHLFPLGFLVVSNHSHLIFGFVLFSY